MNPPTDTLREPARDRFAPSEMFVDLNDAARQLLAEPHEGNNGHRQIALYKTNHTTFALFEFEPGGSLPVHQARGAVIIQVMHGRLRVTTPQTTHEMESRQVLVLSPDVPHDILATEATQMLLTVSMVPA